MSRLSKSGRAQTVIGSAMLLTAVNLYSQVLGFAYRVWLARLIGAEAMGLYQLVMPLYAVVMSLCVSGLTVAVSRLTASYSALGRTRAIGQVVRTARVGYIIMVIAMSAAIIPLSDFVSVTFLGDARTRAGLLLLLPCILLTGWENIHKNYFYGRKNVVPPAVTEVAEQTVRVAAVLGLLWFLSPVYEEWQVACIVLGMIISEVVSAAMLTVFYRRDIAGQSSDGAAESRMTRRVLQVALPVAGANTLGNLIGSANSIIIPGRLITSGMEPSEALSAFGVSFGMTMPLLNLPLAFTVAVGLVMLPRLSESAALQDLKSIRRRVNSALKISGLMIAGCMAVLLPYGAPLARLLFDNPAAGAYMAPLGIATIFVCFEQILCSFLNGLGQQNRVAGNMITVGLIQLGLTWFLVALPELGLMGFVIAFIVSNVLGSALCYIDLRKVLKGDLALQGV